MKKIEIFTKEDIEKYGFIYEPDITKCQSLKLKLCVPESGTMDEDYKTEVANQIPYQYVHQVIESPNPYEGDPNFLADSKVIVVGHTKWKMMRGHA